jgi:hypothetical protein
MVDSMVFDALVDNEASLRAVLAAIDDGRLQLRTTHAKRTSSPRLRTARSEPW